MTPRESKQIGLFARGIHTPRLAAGLLIACETLVLSPEVAV